MYCIENLKNLDKANEDKLFTLFKDLHEHQELFFNQYNQNQGNDKRIYELCAPGMTYVYT